MSKVHWLALSMTPGIGGATARRLVERFGSVEAVFDASDEELLAVSRITSGIVEGLRAVSLEALEYELTSMDDEGVSVITLDDDDYPTNLRVANDAPSLLFMRGDLLPSDEKAVAVVGTREPTPASVALTETLARGLAERGLTIISGLALGIDTTAHKGALLAEGGRTLAVLGSGLRVIHPRENVSLAEEIISHGAVLSEFHPGAPPSGPNLMARDRIVSGLSKAVIVMEAGLKSGSMDTAAKARHQGRLVFAVPGSPGTEELISSGADAVDLAETDLDDLAQRISAPRTSDEPQLGLW